MSFSLRHPTAALRRGPAPWSFWLWAGGTWVVLASAVFRGDAKPPGVGMATWGPGAAVRDALIARESPLSRPSPISSTPQLVALPEPVPDQTLVVAQVKTLMERSSRWDSLRTSLRQFIDREAGEARRWERLIVSDAGEASGNAADLAFRSGTSDSAAPAQQTHFVIGNGSRSDDGRIEPTGRALTGKEIRITLIGDLRTAPPTAAQLHCLTELIDYLRAKTGMIPVQMASNHRAKAPAPGLPQAVVDLAFNRVRADALSSAAGQQAE